MHQVEAVPLLAVAWKLLSGTSVVRRRVVAMPTQKAILVKKATAATVPAALQQVHEDKEGMPT